MDFNNIHLDFHKIYLDFHNIHPDEDEIHLDFSLIHLVKILNHAQDFSCALFFSLFLRATSCNFVAKTKIAENLIFSNIPGKLPDAKRQGLKKFHLSRIKNKMKEGLYEG
jgi:hypothetical protein